MHILIIPSEHLVTESEPLAGIFQYEQAQALANVGHKVGIISVGYITLRYFFKKYNYKEKETVNNIFLLRKYKRIPIPHRYYSFNRLKRKYVSLFLKEFKEYVKAYGMPDIVHAHNFLYAGVIAKELKNKYSLPYVVTEHSSAFARGFISKKVNHKLFEVCNSSNGLTCVSKSFSALLQEVFSSPFNVLPNIVDSSFFEVELNNDKYNNFTFLNIASLDSNKNQKLLLNAFAKKFEGQEVYLKIVGDGPLITQLINETKNLKINSQVEFLGRLPKHEVRNQMLKSHCFVLPSNYETFGVVLIEALASGLPLIATKCGGPEDIVNEGNGVLVDNENLQQLSKAMQKMVQDFYDNGLQEFKPETLRHEALEKYGEQAFVKNAMSYYKLAIETN